MVHWSYYLSSQGFDSIEMIFGSVCWQQAVDVYFAFCAEVDSSAGY